MARTLDIDDACQDHENARAQLAALRRAVDEARKFLHVHTDTVNGPPSSLDYLARTIALANALALVDALDRVRH